MGQIYHNGKFYSGGGENSSQLQSQIDEIIESRNSILEELKKLNEKEIALSSQLETLGVKTDKLVPFTNISTSKTVTEKGKYAVDASELNSSLDGSYAKSIKDLIYSQEFGGASWYHNYGANCDYIINVEHGDLYLIHIQVISAPGMQHTAYLGFAYTDQTTIAGTDTVKLHDIFKGTGEKYGFLTITPSNNKITFHSNWAYAMNYWKLDYWRY